MDPIAETVAAVAELNPLDTDDDLLDQLRATATRIEQVVPECVGFSLTLHKLGVTLTLVATDSDIAALDAIQYVAGGPCVRAVDVDQVLGVDHDVMSEEGWLLFAEATAARGVSSTLSMPVVEQGRVVGGVNLYGSTTTTFDGHHDELGEILGAWAAGAITNADLAFTTLEAARRAPQLLVDDQTLEVAIGLLAGHLEVDIDEARGRLAQSAALAGSDPATVATLVVELLGRRPG